MNVKEEKIRESNGPASEPQNSGNQGNQNNRRGGGGNFRGRNNHMPMRSQHNNDNMNMKDNRDRDGPGRGGYSGRGRGGGGGGRGGNNNRGDSARSENPFLNERLLKMICGPTVDLPPPDEKEKKFNNRCRLYIGNLAPDTTEDEFKNLFVPYGETNELFINREKNFAFIRLDYRSSAEKAKRELDGHVFHNRNLKVRFAPLGSTVKVRNLSTFVTNELLELAFSIFGEIERAVVSVDDRGNSLKEGIVEFSRKGAALSAIRYCHENCYFLTSSLKPVIVEPFECTEDTSGYSEKIIVKKTPEYFQAREVGPRFAQVGSFEHEFGTRWKQIYELYKQKEEALKREMKLEEEKLEAQLQYAKYEHETEMLREQLRKREMDRERQKREWELKERAAEEQRAAEEDALRRQQDELSRRMLHQEDELRRRQQEQNLFMQAETLRNPADFNPNAESLRQQYEAALDGTAPRQPVDGVYDAFGRAAVAGGDRFPDGAPNRGGASPGGGRWAHQDRRIEDFPNKRRRY